MKGYLAMFTVLLLILAAGTAAFGQGEPLPASKVVIIDTGAFFNEKAGISAITSASKKLAADLMPERNKVQLLIARIAPLEKELAAMQDNISKGIPVDQKVAREKAEQLDSLKREGKFQQDEFNALAQKQQNLVVGPVYAAAMKALGEYIKSKGYDLVFDVSKDQDGMLIYASDQYDITKEFITFYNARPPTVITSVPK